MYEFNSAQTGLDDGQLFAFFVRNEQQAIVAGLSGWTWANACEIRALWVHPAWRGQGYGQSLLESAEQEARARGCKRILISSYSFQAPAFYQKHGYMVAWQLDDFPPGHLNYYFVKPLFEAFPAYPHRDELIYVSHTVPKRQVGRVSLRNGETLVLLVCRTELIGGDPPRERQKEASTACIQRHDMGGARDSRWNG